MNSIPHYLRSPDRNPLDAIFKPEAVAVVGATEKQGSVGRTLFKNLINYPFGGTVYPVNLKRANVLGVKAYPSLSDLPGPVDLAVIATPAPTVPSIIQECVEVGVKGVVIISAGFKELGPSGVELEQKISQQIKESNLRIIGPNCVGIMNPLTGLNATFANAIARPGNVGFISQSGAMCTAILDWSFKEKVGFSTFVSVGSMLDVGWGELIDYFGDDPRTSSIVIYMESIGNARSFLSAAREVALNKPIIVIKAGRTKAAALAAASHTGSMTGSDEVLDAAFRRCGVLRVDSISELFDMSEVLAKQPRPRGKKLTILTNAGGPGVLATDALITKGGELAELSPQTHEALNEILPPHWSRNNPIDILGDADPDRYQKAVEIAAKEPNSDGLLVILAPQDMTDPSCIAEQLRQVPIANDKPILASWMGGPSIAAGENILNQANIPTFDYPDTAAKIFNYMCKYTDNLKRLYETPRSAHIDHQSARDNVAKILESVRKNQRTILTEHESKQVLSLYSIPTIPSFIEDNADKAVERANEIGYPVVLKIHSETITHKSDVGGICLNLKNEEDVRKAFIDIKNNVYERVGSEHFLGVNIQPMINSDESYEIIVGSSIDPQFGPVLLFGTGGTLVEIYKDSSLALPPLNTTLAKEMMARTNIYKAFKGIRGRKSVDVEALAQLMVRFSQLVVEHSWIKEIDINPLLVSGERLLALDARVILHDPQTSLQELPGTAIRPYPSQYVSNWTMNNGENIKFRPISPEDEPLMQDFHRTLAEYSVNLRYFHLINLSQRVTHERLTRLCFIDYDREIALVAIRLNENNDKQILGIARLIKKQGFNEAEFALLVADEVQRSGLGTALMEELIKIGRKEKLQRITGRILKESIGMYKICEKLGFNFELDSQSDLQKAILEL